MDHDATCGLSPVSDLAHFTRLKLRDRAAIHTWGEHRPRSRQAYAGESLLFLEPGVLFDACRYNIIAQAIMSTVFHATTEVHTQPAQAQPDIPF